MAHPHEELYYELQTLQRVWPERLGKMVAGLHQLQDQIGADHDLIVLNKSLRRLLMRLAAPKR